MKKENIYIDLSKCSKEERKSIPQILENAGENIYEETLDCLLNDRLDDEYIYLALFFDGEWLRFNDNLNRTELTYPEFIKLFEGGDVENETSLQIAIKALKNISNPIEYMKSQLEEGDTLNGAYAVMLSEKPQFYQNIAEEALRKINSNLIKQDNGNN